MIRMYRIFLLFNLSFSFSHVCSLFLNYLGDYSYSFQGSSELISITVTASLISSRMQLGSFTSPGEHFSKIDSLKFVFFQGGLHLTPADPCQTQGV